MCNIPNLAGQTFLFQLKPQLEISLSHKPVEVILLVYVCAYLYVRPSVRNERNPFMSSPIIAGVCVFLSDKYLTF